jgi:capsular polysaccharide biosynthesis protein
MTSLRRCVRYSNKVDARLSDPSVEIWRRAYYVPINDRVAWEHGGGWGLFDADGATIEASNYYRGPGKNVVGQGLSTDLPLSSIDVAPPGKYLYGGNLINHYGHFLLSTLSRFWLAHIEDISHYRIVCHAAGTPSSWFSNRFVRDIFGSLGLTEKNFVVFKRPTLLPEVMVPRPSAEEHNFTHQIYNNLGRTIGQNFLRDFELEINDRPIWLSKTKLGSGVQGIANEDRIVELMEAEGVEIIHPQELFPLAQVMMFNTRSKIMSAAGSALHTKLFGAAGRVICLINHETINSNYALTETFSPNPIEFYTCDMHESTSATKKINQSLVIENPENVARELLSAIHN